MGIVVVRSLGDVRVRAGDPGILHPGNKMNSPCWEVRTVDTEGHRDLLVGALWDPIVL